MRLSIMLAAAVGLLTAALPLFAGEPAGLPPAPGTYRLDRIQRVPQAIVLEGSLIPRLLSHYIGGKITLFGFFYSYCADPEGCPLAWDAFEKVRAEIMADAKLHGRIRLVFMSLDPAHDSPDAMKGFAQRYEAGGRAVPWHFLTTYSGFFLKPLLRGMGEEVSARPGEDGVVLNHMLKVFLIDKEGWVREIYSSQTLDPVLVLGDIRTLLLEETALSP
ncbi:MAG TPA: SCO family protein [Methylocella sp.]|nr:SCO family protein [Methylocella sp.]